MRFYEDPVPDGDDDDRVVQCKSTSHRSYKSRSASVTYLHFFPSTLALLSWCKLWFIAALIKSFTFSALAQFCWAYKQAAVEVHF